MAGVSQTFALEWEGRSVEVTATQDWLNSGHTHIELRCSERLPVTSTGYRSQFVLFDAPVGEAEILGHVLAWLDEAAARREWQQYVEVSRQLSLF